MNQQAEVIIKNNGPSLVNVQADYEKNIVLVPGTNYILGTDWDYLSTKHKNFMYDVKVGKIELLADPRVGGGASKGTSGSTLDVPSGELPQGLAVFAKAEDAIKAIRDTNDLYMLEKWLETEKRRILVTELNSRIKFIRDELKSREVEKSNAAIGKQPPGSEGGGSGIS